MRFRGCALRLAARRRILNDDLLISVAKASGVAEGMTYIGVYPTTMLVEGGYPKGVKLDKKSMKPCVQCAVIVSLACLIGNIITILPDKLSHLSLKRLMPCLDLFINPNFIYRSSQQFSWE